MVDRIDVIIDGVRDGSVSLLITTMQFFSCRALACCAPLQVNKCIGIQYCLRCQLQLESRGFLGLNLRRQLLCEELYSLGIDSTSRL
jgi:hypothetical protein